jgi:polysaccharide biosynthesis protein PslF
MKVIIVTASFPPMSTGGADYAFRLCQHLADRGVQLHVITHQTALAHMDQVQIYPLMNKWSWSELPRLMKLIARIEPDVANLHFGGFLYNDHPMISFLATFVKRRLPSVRFVTLVEAPIGVQPYQLSRLIHWSHKAYVQLMRGQGVDYSFGTLLRDSDSIIVLSDAHRSYLANYNPSINKKTVLMPAPPLMQILEGSAEVRLRGRKDLGVSDGDLLVAYCGYLYPGKGVETLLSAFKLALEKMDNLRLVMIGGTPEIVLKTVGRLNYGEELRTLSQDLGIAHAVHWTGGYETDSERPSLYLRASDFCVLPFDRGVFLNNSSFASCAAHGLAVVTTNGATMEPPFKDRENVLLCPPEDPALMAERILELAEDCRLRAKIGRGAEELFESLLSWPRTIERTMLTFGGQHTNGLL